MATGECNDRAKHTRLLTKRATTHYEKEKLAIEKRLRREAEMKRLTTERQQVVEEISQLRLEYVKLQGAEPSN
ncbi:hypothetical protein PsorP6_015454 [Peronosclerospora sorghi]|uniref:Uncharacterized protein n=1 Tax=Peronosclerospora sorghi TaxID=230839 RepID=A0ACC0WPC8_9STRA|nr:hypothetical protein PsorP6_015454 [Peronosclerospora sorghi]